MEPVTPRAMSRPSRRPVMVGDPSREAQLQGLAAADLGVEEPEPLEREVRVDDVDTLDRRRPGGRAEATREDRPDVTRLDAGIGRELPPDPGEQPRRQRLVAEDRAALD